MKKTILAVAIPALFAASAQAANVYDADGVSADVYGRMQFTMSDDGTDTNGVGTARMGFNVKSEIAPGLAAIAKGEWQIAAENSAKSSDGSIECTDNTNASTCTVTTESKSQFAARHVYAGFEFDDAGTVVFGQTDTAFYKAVEATDIFNGDVGYEAFNNIEDGRQEGQIVYNGEFGGFYVGASYQFKDDNFKIGVNPGSATPPAATGETLDSGYAGTLGYTFADIGLSTYVGYHVETFANFEDKKNFALSAAYSLDNLYLGAAYVTAKMGDAELEGYDIVAAYTIDAVKLYTGYAAQEDKDNVDTADAFKLGAQYAFNSNMKAWAEYKVNGLDGADDYWEMSLQYNF
ncbi:porin [Agarivorans sp. QJM3NY_25]|uniref:porin n=1 Tax=Agarivorans sp. QJM3NY_25 TaxID=3421430 RepID=UPI003D7E92A6